MLNFWTCITDFQNIREPISPNMSSSSIFILTRRWILILECSNFCISGVYIILLFSMTLVISSFSAGVFLLLIIFCLVKRASLANNFFVPKKCWAIIMVTLHYLFSLTRVVFSTLLMQQISYSCLEIVSSYLHDKQTRIDYDLGLTSFIAVK